MYSRSINPLLIYFLAKILNVIDYLQSWSPTRK